MYSQRERYVYAPKRSEREGEPPSLCPRRRSSHDERVRETDLSFRTIRRSGEFFDMEALERLFQPKKLIGNMGLCLFFLAVHVFIGST